MEGCRVPPDARSHQSPRQQKVRLAFTSQVTYLFLCHRHDSSALLPLIKSPFSSCRINDNPSLTAKRKGKKRKIAETSNVITETLPSVEGEQVSMFKIKSDWEH